MAKSVILADGIQPTVTTAVELYTSPANGGGTRISAFTASLITGTETYRVFIGATATDATEIMPTRSIIGPDSEQPYQVIGQNIGAGDKLFVQVSTGTTIAFRVTGNEL